MTLAVARLLALAAAFAVSAARADIAYTWGDNQYGQLGNGTTNHSPVPIPVTGMTSVTSVAAGDQHSLAVMNGGVYAWGASNNGQLGVVPPPQNTAPVAVTGLSSGVTAVAAGPFDSLAVQNGAVYTWGYNLGGTNYTPIAVGGLSSGVTAIAEGNGYGLALQNGGLYGWGVNGYGQIGDGTTGIIRTNPVPVIGLSSGVTAIATGYDDSLVVQNGAAFAWGHNNFGKLGDGTTTDRSTPVPVTGLSSGVTSLAGGDYFSLALRNGNVYTWGSNIYGQLGDGTTTDHITPVEIDPADLHNIVAIAAGNSSSYALSADGSIWDWGYDLFGQLGIGTYNESYLTPQHLLPPSGYRFTSIEAGSDGDHVVATMAAVPEPPASTLLVIGAVAAVIFFYLRRAKTCSA